VPHPDATNWLDLHGRLAQGDLDAGKKIVEHFHRRLSQRLVYRRAGVDAHLAAESADIALLNYLANPGRFDPGRRVPLGYWLWVQARGHLSHLLRRERRHQSHQWTVGVGDENFEKCLSKMGLERAICKGRDDAGIEEWRQALEESLLPRLSLFDRLGIELLRRDAPFGEWVEHLRITPLPTAERRRKVNAEKARLKKKVRRLAKRLGLALLKEVDL
jgi:hypothetical protein